jgi:hypothetical protein
MRFARACRIFAICVFAPTIVAAVSFSASAQGWTTYHNARFGVTADVPASWKSDPPPENGDGLIFNSPDGAAHLTVSGSLNSDPVAEAMAFYEESGKDRTVTYKHRESRAITLSGTKGDMIFYERHILSCGDQIWNSVYLEYPAASKKDFDPLVTHISHSLRPGVSGWVTKCK